MTYCIPRDRLRWEWNGLVHIGFGGQRPSPSEMSFLFITLPPDQGVWGMQMEESRECIDIWMSLRGKDNWRRRWVCTCGRENNKDLQRARETNTALIPFNLEARAAQAARMHPIEWPNATANYTGVCDRNRSEAGDGHIDTALDNYKRCEPRNKRNKWRRDKCKATQSKAAVLEDSAASSSSIACWERGWADCIEGEDTPHSTSGLANTCTTRIED